MLVLLELKLALLIHCQELALGSRVAPPLDAGWHSAKFACLQKVPPASQGCSLGAATPPPRIHRCKVTAWLWQFWWCCTRLLVLQVGAGQLLCIRVVVPPVAALAVVQGSGGGPGGDWQRAGLE